MKAERDLGAWGLGRLALGVPGSERARAYLAPAGECPVHAGGVKSVRLSQKYPPGYNLGVAHRDSSVAHREGRTPWLEWSCWERAWRDTPLPST